MTEQYDVIVIGGGPSGMICAGRAAEYGARVLLLEKNAILGKKLLRTGGGRCNITNALFDTEEFLSHLPNAKKFLYSPFSQFSVADTFAFFEKQNVPLTIEARNRAFPTTQSATDVRDALVRYMQSGNVTIKTNTSVAHLTQEQKHITHVTDTKNTTYTARYIVIATGGFAAPDTGSTGDGIRMLKNCGHTTHRANPNLVPLISHTQWVRNLSGITWSHMKIRFVQNDKTCIRRHGKILFTHFGISGPLVINASHDVKKLLAKGPVSAVIDLFPDTLPQTLDKKLIALLHTHADKKMKNVLPELLFKNIAYEILALPDIQLQEQYAKFVTRGQRKKLVHALKNLTLSIDGTCGMDKAIVADGGVAPEEIDFKNMTSRLYANLYVVGDMININRPSGGFSLQLCWTMGYVAGDDIGQKITQK